MGNIIRLAFLVPIVVFGVTEIPASFSNSFKLLPLCWYCCCNNTNSFLFIINNCSCVALLRGKSITQLQLIQDVLYRILTFHPNKKVPPKQDYIDYQKIASKDYSETIPRAFIFLITLLGIISTELIWYEWYALSVVVESTCSYLHSALYSMNFLHSVS